MHDRTNSHQEENLIEALNLATSFSATSRQSLFDDSLKRKRFNSIDLLQQIPPASASFNHLLKSSIDYLNINFSMIRILIGFTVSGSGHQNSSLEVARQLRHHGYTGKIEIFWSCDEISKFDHIRQAFMQDMAQYPYALSFIHDKKEIKKQKCDLAITGGYDHEYIAGKEANARVVLVLQPYQWLFKDSGNEIDRCIMIEKIFSENTILHDKLKPDSLNDKHLGYHYVDKSPSLLSLSGYPVLDDMIQQTRAGQMHLLTAYSVNRLWCPEVPLINLLKGLTLARQSDSQFRKKTVIFLVDNFTDQQKENVIEEIFNRVGPVKVMDADNHEVVRRAAMQQILSYVFAPKLPEPVFTMLLQASSLPPLFEGANTTNKRLCMAAQSGKYSLYVFR